MRSLSSTRLQPSAHAFDPVQRIGHLGPHRDVFVGQQVGLAARDLVRERGPELARLHAAAAQLAVGAEERALVLGGAANQVAVLAARRPVRDRGCAPTAPAACRRIRPRRSSPVVADSRDRVTRSKAIPMTISAPSRGSQRGSQPEISRNFIRSLTFSVAWAPPILATNQWPRHRRRHSTKSSERRSRSPRSPNVDHLLYVGDLPLPEESFRGKPRARKKLVQAVVGVSQREVIEAAGIPVLPLPDYDLGPPGEAEDRAGQRHRARPVQGRRRRGRAAGAQAGGAARFDPGGDRRAGGRGRVVRVPAGRGRLRRRHGRADRAGRQHRRRGLGGPAGRARCSSSATRAS